jgi:hypothetical protein
MQTNHSRLPHLDARERRLQPPRPVGCYNEAMHKPHPGIIALVTISALTDFAAVSFARKESYSWEAECFIWGLTLSQNSLVWTWASLGRTRFIVRFTCSSLTMLGLTKLQSWGSDAPKGRDWSVALFFGTMALAMIIVWTLARLLSMTLIRQGDRTSVGQPMRFQYSLWNFMEFTTAVAVLAAIVKFAYSPISLDPRLAQQLLVVFLLGLPFAGLSLLMTWVLLRQRFSAALLFLLAGVLWGTCLIVGVIIRPGPDDRSTAVVLTVAALSLASLIACRLCGYRIVRDCFDGLRSAAVEQATGGQHDGA